MAAAEAVRDSTVVALIGDHGWSLGEGNIWCKMTNNENGARVPLMFRPPGYAYGGAKLRQLAEAVDLYKTLADLSGLGVGMVESGVDGVSLAPIINRPTAMSHAPLRTAAKTQFPRCFNQTIMAKYPSVLAPLDRTDCQDIPKEHFDLMGYSSPFPVPPPL
jgi:arylsulfatase A-like enzyme